MNVRDVVYETARQFSEIAAAQYWIQQRIGDLNQAATDIRAALKDQQQWLIEALGIAQEIKKRKKKAKKRNKTGKKRNEIVKKRKPQKKQI